MTDTNNGASSISDFVRTIGKISRTSEVNEDHSTAALRDRKIPVLSCDGPCIKGEIARRAATLMPQLDSRFQRASHGETFYVPYSTMAKWVANADSVAMIDGCFLNCHGRVLANLVDQKKIVHINAHSIHKEFGDTFSFDDVPDSEIAELAEQVAREALEIASAGPDKT